MRKTSFWQDFFAFDCTHTLKAKRAHTFDCWYSINVYAAIIWQVLKPFEAIKTKILCEKLVLTRFFRFRLYSHSEGQKSVHFWLLIFNQCIFNYYLTSFDQNQNFMRTTSFWQDFSAFDCTHTLKAKRAHTFDIQ